MAITGIEDLRHAATRGLGGAKQLGWYPGYSDGEANWPISLNTLYAVPFPIGVQAVTITDLLVGFNANASSISARIGLYSARADGWPNALLYESSPFVVASTTQRHITTTMNSLVAGGALYYTALLVSSDFLFWSGPQTVPSLYGFTPDLTATHYSLTASWAFSALPPTFPGSGVPFDNGPLFGVIFA